VQDASLEHSTGGSISRDAAAIRQRVDACIDQMVELGLASRAELRPASVEDLEVAEQRLGPLPIAYRRFLERVGRGAGRFMQGWFIYFPYNDENQDDLISILAELPEPWSPKPDNIVIASLQSYSVLFLDRVGDDPAVKNVSARDGLKRSATTSPTGSARRSRETRR
jgi:hypothetical protein